MTLRRHNAAVNAARRSIEVDPNYADGYGMLAHCLAFFGELDKAIDAIREAQRLNPHYPFLYLWVEAHVLFLMGRDEDALVLLRKALERNPNFDLARLLLAATLGQLGREEDASWEAEEILVLNPDFSIATAKGQPPYKYKRAEDLDRYFDGLRKAGLPE